MSQSKAILFVSLAGMVVLLNSCAGPQVTPLLDAALHKKSELPTGGQFIPHPNKKNLQYYFTNRQLMWPDKSNAQKNSGLYVSIDAGKTWKLKCRFFEFEKLFIHPETNMLYAIIDYTWLVPNKDGFLLPHYANKVIMSEEGKHWQWRDITGEPGYIADITGIFKDPDNPKRICLEVVSLRGYILQAVDDAYTKWKWYKKWKWKDRPKKKEEKGANKPLLSGAPHQDVKLDYDGHMLSIIYPLLGDKPLKINCMEAYCKKGSTHRRWEKTIIPQQNEVLSKSPHEIKVKTSLASGIEVMHRFAVVADEILFEATFTNLTEKPVDIEWMQPCIRVADFTGLGQDNYIRKCFIFTERGLTRLTKTNRTEKAIYRGGQVYVPAGIDRDDVNPRPLSPDVPANSLIGCFSADEKTLLATAWTDVQELFQGVIVCIHADPCIGGLGPAQRKKIWGKLYIIPNDTDELLRRYRRDFEAKSGN